jgi:phosphomethylpyrimidine synthase
MKITQEVREFAAAKGIAEQEGIAAGMQAKAQEFNRAGGEFYIPIASDTTAR